LKKIKLFTVDILAIMLVLGSVLVSCGAEEDPFPSKTDTTTANDGATLGIVGTAVSSSNASVATADLADGKIAIVSHKAGTATIRVIQDEDTSDAEIPVTVDSSGTIVIGTIAKGGLAIMRIGGTINVSLGQSSVSLGIYGEGVTGRIGTVAVDGSGHWLLKTVPLESQTPLYFDVDIGFSDGSGISYSINKETANVSVGSTSKTNIALPAISGSNFITLSGTAAATLDGQWNVNQSLQVRISSDKDWLFQAQVAANNTWTAKVPGSTESTHISFSVHYQNKDDWEMGQKNGLAPREITNQNVSGIDLGTTAFVLLSGTTPVTVDGVTPIAAIVQFGEYSPGGNGYTAETKAIDAQGNWAIPVPADIALQAVILYKVSSTAEQWKQSGGYPIANTGATAQTIDLSSIATITAE
jgi:hypothetical protein